MVVSKEEKMNIRKALIIVGKTEEEGTFSELRKAYSAAFLFIYIYIYIYFLGGAYFRYFC